MDEYFGEMDCRYRADTIMMSLLRSAMDNAHERVQSKDGPIECLHERSKFYELAIIQIEGSLQLIHEEADGRIIPESNREKMLSDLMELQEILRGRLKEMKFSIMEKDKELMERLENELKLKQALESRERELLFLRSKLELERTNSESIQEFILSQQEGKEGDFSELKNSVDQQVLNIKQRLKDSRQTSSNLADFLELGFQTLEEERYSSEETNENEFCLGTKVVDDLLRPEQNIVIKQMSSDIDILKGTLDLAFGRMQKAEVRPLEKQWRWSIEKETISILIKGFLSDLKQNLKAELGKRDMKFPSGLSSEDCFEMIDEMIKLRDELENALSIRNETEEKKVKGKPPSGSKSEVDEKKSSTSDVYMDGSLKIRRTSSEPIMEFIEALPEEDLEDNSGSNNYVAKMIKNHESIIRKQQEELNWLKIKEAFRRKAGGLSAKREKELDGLERNIRNVIARLDNVIKWKAKLGGKKGIFDNVIPKCHIPKRMKMNTDDEVTMKDETIRRLKQEKDDSNLEHFAMEENYEILLKGLMKDSYDELYACDIERSLMEDAFVHYLREMSKEWRLSFENGFMEMQIREEIYYIVCRETINNSRETCQSTTSLALRQHQEVRIPQNFIRKFSSNTQLSEPIESLLKEDVYMIFFREMEKEWNMEKDAYEMETFFKEDVYEFVIVEAVKDAHNTLDKHTTIMDQDCREEESLIQNLDSFLEFFEKVEEDLTIRESTPEIKEHSEKSTTFGLVSDKLEKAMRQLSGSKKLLTELKYSLEIEPPEDLNKEDDQINSIDEDVDEREDSFDSRLTPLIEFKQVLMHFDDMVHEKLQQNFLRLEQVKNKVDPLLQLAASTREKELLYKKAFTRRCHNLRLAETEVDVLGDQVESLLGLLEKIYLVLDQYSPVLSQYFGVLYILNLIKKELAGAGAAYTPNL